MVGLTLEGLFIGAAEKVKEGKPVGWYVSVACGVDTYKVSVQSVPADLAFGTPCFLTVKPGCFNNKLFYSGEFVRKED